MRPHRGKGRRADHALVTSGILLSLLHLTPPLSPSPPPSPLSPPPSPLSPPSLLSLPLSPPPHLLFLLDCLLLYLLLHLALHLLLLFCLLPILLPTLAPWVQNTCWSVLDDSFHAERCLTPVSFPHILTLCARPISQLYHWQLAATWVWILELVPWAGVGHRGPETTVLPVLQEGQPAQ